MSIKDQIVKFKKIGFPDNEDYDIDNAVNILNDIAQRADNGEIVALCGIFNDELEPSLESDLIETIFHIIECNGFEEGLYELTLGLLSTSQDASVCVKRTFKTLLNSEDFIKPYKRVVKKMASSKREEVLNILREIVDRQPDQYAGKVNYLLGDINDKL